MVVKLCKESVSSEQFLEAIQDGVREAIWNLATNDTCMPCADFYEFIRRGVQDAFENFSFEDENTRLNDRLIDINERLLSSNERMNCQLERLISIIEKKG